MDALTEPQRQPFPTCAVCRHQDHGLRCSRGVRINDQFGECGCLGVWVDAREVAP